MLTETVARQRKEMGGVNAAADGDLHVWAPPHIKGLSTLSPRAKVWVAVRLWVLCSSVSLAFSFLSFSVCVVGGCVSVCLSLARAARTRK